MMTGNDYLTSPVLSRKVDSDGDVADTRSTSRESPVTPTACWTP